MNQCHQSWESALANFVATAHAIKAAKQSSSTLFASYSRISTFVYCRIHILSVAGIINSFLLSNIFATVVIFLFSLFYLHTPHNSWFSKKWKWGWMIAFLCLITCSFFCEISPILLQPSSYQYSTSYMIFR